MNNFSHISDNARVWIFASPKAIPSANEKQILDQINTFLRGWQAHGKDLESSVQLEKSHFIIIAVNEEVAQATGCSIDSMMRFMREIEQVHDLILTDRSLVYWESNNGIHSAPFTEIRDKISNGFLNESVKVFDTSTSSGIQLKSKWPTEAGNTWLSKFFRKTNA